MGGVCIGQDANSPFFQRPGGSDVSALASTKILVLDNQRGSVNKALARLERRGELRTVQAGGPTSSSVYELVD